MIPNITVTRQVLIVVVFAGLLALALWWYHAGAVDPDVGLAAIERMLRRGTR